MLNTGVEVAIRERFRLGEATHMGANIVNMGAKMGAKKRVKILQTIALPCKSLHEVSSVC